MSDGRIAPMSKNQSKRILSFAFLVVIGLALVGVIAYRIPSINARLSWRVDIAMTYLRGVIYPVKPFPTPAEPDPDPGCCPAATTPLGATGGEQLWPRHIGPLSALLRLGGHSG
jgi:hypothetical protein